VAAERAPGGVAYPLSVPALVLPSAAVRDSYLAGERATWEEAGRLPSWLAEAETNFAGFAAGRAHTRTLWGVPTTELWYVSGPEYLGTVMIRHRLTPELQREGGHIGYHVVPAKRRRGHATAMLAGALDRCRADGMTEVLITCREDNIASRRVIEVNGGKLDAVAGGICRYLIGL
jgi:predicted acetyltransferase